MTSKHLQGLQGNKKPPNLRKTYREGSVNGYIRDHLCPSNYGMRHRMKEQTFYFTNTAPQDSYLNGWLWAWLDELLATIDQELEAIDGWLTLKTEPVQNGTLGPGED